MPMIYLDPNAVPAHLRAGYNGKKFKVEVCETLTIPSYAGNWDGGSRDVYTIIRLADGAAVDMPGQDAAPWDRTRADREVSLTADLAVVRHTTFCGKDMGLTFYLHPVAAAPMLPAPAAPLSRVESLVLGYTVGRKSSYNGQNRYQMMRDDYRHGYMRDKPETCPTNEDWESAKVELTARGFLTRAGAITPAGRNVAERI